MQSILDFNFQKTRQIQLTKLNEIKRFDIIKNFQN